MKPINPVVLGGLNMQTAVAAKYVDEKAAAESTIHSLELNIERLKEAQREAFVKLEEVIGEAARGAGVHDVRPNGIDIYPLDIKKAYNRFNRITCQIDRAYKTIDYIQRHVIGNVILS